MGRYQVSERRAAMAARFHRSSLLSPAATRSAIQLLEQRAPGHTFGDILETEGGETANVNG